MKLSLVSVVGMLLSVSGFSVLTVPIVWLLLIALPAVIPVLLMVSLAAYSWNRMEGVVAHAEVERKKLAARIPLLPGSCHSEQNMFETSQSF